MLYLRRNMSSSLNIDFLQELREERGKFSGSDESLMQRLIEGLVNKGIYPSEPTGAMKKMGYSILDMVKSWGVDWYQYDDPLECPHCKANLRNEEDGPPFKREIAMSDFFLDVVVDYVCPECYKSLEGNKQYNKEEFEKAEKTPPLD
jgi:rubredoxin